MDEQDDKKGEVLKSSDDPTRESGDKHGRVIHAIRATSWSGPLPPPALLQEYETVFPGCADRIVGMAERQASHRQHLESTALRGNQWAELRGQIFGFAIGMFALWFGRDLVLAGYSFGGVGLFIGGIASLVAVFIRGKKSQSKELEQKREELDNPQMDLFPSGDADAESE